MLALPSTKRSRNYAVSLAFKTITGYTSNLRICLYWDPGFSGIVGNEDADEPAAGAALENTVDITTLPYTDAKPHIIQQLLKNWQADWSKQTTHYT